MVDIISRTPVASIGRAIFVPAGLAERKSCTAATAKAQCEAQCQITSTENNEPEVLKIVLKGKIFPCTWPLLLFSLFLPAF